MYFGRLGRGGETINPQEIMIAVFVGLVGIGVGFYIRKNLAEAKIATAEVAAARIVEDAEKASEAKKKEVLLEAKEEIHKLRSEAEREQKERRSELQRLERRQPGLPNGYSDV